MPQVMLVKSMSKDFGIAGLRAGYALMSPERVEALLSNGFLWNISGLCEFFFVSSPSRSFNKSTHWRDCATSTRRATSSWSLGEIESLRAYPTKANFCLVELDPSLAIEMLAPLLLIRYGVYIRDCSDKIGLEDGQYIRVAGRKKHENELMLTALKDAIGACALARNAPSG